jgi:Spy/CpxP family protein refolding chaperone
MPTAEAIEIHIREQEQLDNRIADRAASILTPEQLSNLRQEQAKRLGAMKASTDMVRAMWGGAQPAAK